MRTKHIITLLCGVLLAFSLAIAVADAQTSTLALQITPASLKLAPGDHRDVVVAVTNPLTETLRGLKLTWFSDAGVDVTIRTSPASDLPPQATAAWQLDLLKKPDGINTGTVSFRLDYTTTVASQSVPHVILGSLEIQARQLDTLEKVATARVESAVEKVEENQAGVLYLIVTNVSDVPITVKQTKLNRPDLLVDVKEPPTASQPITIPTNVSAVFPYTVSVSITLPGKRLFLFETQLEWTRSGQSYAGTLNTPYNFSTEVFGSELLTLVGVPSLLLLPGMLIVTVFFFVLAKTAVHTNNWDVKDAKFWVVAITVSFLVLLVYPTLGFLTKPFGLSSNFLQGYSLKDVIYLWLGSILFGLLAGALTVIGVLAIRGVRSLWLASRTPSEGDEALELLQKLARNNLGIAREQYQIVRNNRAQNVFALEKVKADPIEWWAAPSIVVKWKPAVAGLADPARNDLKQQLAAALESYGDTKTIVALIRKGERWLAVDWDRSGVIQTPVKVKASEAKRLAGVRRIVEERQDLRGT